ncbi:VOC family protein [Rhodococcus jostii]|uniref:VOC family protein n=1 Tax=Rhodococcus jostii TaxID=132919 RepID=UPI0036442753
MSPTIRSLVIPVSDMDSARAAYSALLGAPHTDESCSTRPAACCRRNRAQRSTSVAPETRICVPADADGNPIPAT